MCMIWRSIIGRMKRIGGILPEFCRRKRWKSGYKISGLVSGLEEMVKKAGDSKGADAAGSWSDGGEVFSSVEFRGKVTFDDAVFTGRTGIYKSGAGGDKITRNQPRNARGTNDYIKLLKVCQVVATVKESDVVV